MVNLISPSTKRSLLYTYYTRLATAVLVLIGSATIIGVALLLPSYFLIHADADQAADYVKTASAIASERAKSAAPDTLARFTESVKLLTGANKSPAIAKVLALVSSDIPRGLSIDKIDVTFDQTGSAMIVVVGTAATRTELLSYENQMKNTHAFASVVVPVSDLVADTNSPFTLTLTWVPPPKP